jgi:sRNA-binding regulator protein Hfq
MSIVLTDGEVVNGVIEWYDRTCLKVVRNGGPNMIIYKQAIRYMYKQSEK